MSILRKFLFPFSLLYGLIIMVRKGLYDVRLLKSKSYPLPVVCVGNLSVGGTGKTPMIEYLLNLLLRHYRVATLSRGYGRSSKGFKLLKINDQAKVAGDEPLQFKIKFPEAAVAVDESRQRGIDTLISEKDPEVILLDDAFQHRKVKAGLNILLTIYGKLYIDDFILPTGDLREPATGAQRAKIIVVTKCPEDLSIQEQDRIKLKLKLHAYQHLFFSYIGYGDQLVNKDENIPVASLKNINFTLVTGIANTQPLLEFLSRINPRFNHLKFPDHHNFKKEDLNLIRSAEFVITTEKDYMRLKDSVSHEALYYLPIKSKFLQNASAFDKLVTNYVNEK